MCIVRTESWGRRKQGKQKTGSTWKAGPPEGSPRPAPQEASAMPACAGYSVNNADNPGWRGWPRARSRLPWAETQPTLRDTAAWVAALLGVAVQKTVLERASPVEQRAGRLLNTQESGSLNPGCLSKIQARARAAIICTLHITLIKWIITQWVKWATSLIVSRIYAYYQYLPNRFSLITTNISGITSPVEKLVRHNCNQVIKMSISSNGTNWLIISNGTNCNQNLIGRRKISQHHFWYSYRKHINLHLVMWEHPTFMDTIKKILSVILKCYNHEN